jgi:DNA-directed RNA polymerase subunit RPC12/RpoP
MYKKFKGITGNLGKTYKGYYRCLHCSRKFHASILTMDDDGFIFCPFKDCDGSELDFFSVIFDKAFQFSMKGGEQNR